MKNSSSRWPVIRTALFILIGLMNTVLIRPEDLYTFKHYLGIALLFAGLIDGSMLLHRRLRAKGRRSNGS